MSAPLIGLGKAVELQMIRNGKRETVGFPRYWWAWSGGKTTGTIVLAHPTGTQAPHVRNTRHVRFHGSPSEVTTAVDVPEMNRTARVIGQAIAVAYDARTMTSNKSDSLYRHHFGSFTHDDRPPFDAKYWPDVCVDRAGRLFLRRRPGNAYRMDDWLIG